MSICDTAIDYRRAGLCVLPAILAQKRPVVPSWKSFQTRLPTEIEVGRWFEQDRAVCLICGAISGNLEMIDFDLGGEAFQAWYDAIERADPDLLGRLVIEQSPSGGWHVAYWRRPGKTSGWSASLKEGVLFVFSSSATPFEPQQAYSPFSVYALLEHGGDFARAASALRGQGFGGEDTRKDVDLSAFKPDLSTPGTDKSASTIDKSAPGTDKSKVQFTAITSKELAENHYELVYLIDGLLVRGQPGVIAGPKKSLKTNVSIDLAISLSHAGLFLDRFNVPEAVRVGIMSGESGAATIQETARRIADAKDWHLRDFDNVVWSFDIPQLGNSQHIDALRRFILDYELEVLILDPTYLMMMGIGNDAGNLFIVGSFLKSIGELAQETGCTPLLCHHMKKSVSDPYEPAELEDIAWAGFQEFVRQWILLNRRVKYDPDNGGHHELWMSAGGSAGHSGLWGLNIDEGTRQDVGGRRWELELISATQAYEERDNMQEEAKAEETAEEGAQGDGRTRCRARCA